MTIWVNFTSSHRWQGNPVGIVRYETEVARELEMILPWGMVRRCAWIDDRFEEVHDRQEIESANLAGTEELEMKEAQEFAKVALSVAPQGTAPYLLQATEKIQPTLARVLQQAQEVEYMRNSCRKKAIMGMFYPGDIFITVGMDYEYSYVENFWEMKQEGVRIICCVHDLIPIKYPQYCHKYVAEKFPAYLLKIAESSDCMMCVSRHTEKDLQDFLYEAGMMESRIIVVRQGEKELLPQGKLSEKVRELAEQDFILYVSTIERRKNHTVLYHACRLLWEMGKGESLPKLIFVGMPGWGTENLMRDMAEDPLTKDRIVIMNNITDAELALLYQNALFCVFPSFYEGWGIPMREAMAAGKLVISSDAGALTESGGDLAVYLSPFDTTAWAEQLLHFATDRQDLKNRESRIRAGYKRYTYRQTAEQIREIIESIQDGEEKNETAV